MNFFKTNFDKTVEKLLVNFLSKIRYGKLTVQFPTGEEKVFVGKEEDISANIKSYMSKRYCSGNNLKDFLWYFEIPYFSMAALCSLVG